jgi:DTW domain-containing protein
MRSSTSPDFTRRCIHCWLQLEYCLCSEVPRVETSTRLVVVRHALETPKSTNTARIALLALPNAELWEYGGAENRFDESVLHGPDTWLLFPDGGGAQRPEVSPKRLIVLDGTWPQARRMVQRLGALRGVPRLSLPSPALPPQRLRQPPLAEGLSTIEAIAAAIGLLEGEEKAQRIHDLHELMIRRVLEVRARGGSREAVR